MSQILSGSERSQGVSRVVVLSRLAHALIAVGFLFCIGSVYYGAWLGVAGPETFLAVAILVIEGVLVLAGGGDCPLVPLLRRLGDDTPLFELALPPRAAALTVPVLGAVTAVGMVLLAARTF